MNRLKAVFTREFNGYFATPLAYVFLVIFLGLTGGFTFYLGGFFEAGQADLRSFFAFHPWLYLFLIPAVGMRLWAEENRSGTIELLLTLPIPLWAAVVGKFLAAWAFVGLGLVLTAPMWLTVNYLGQPDNGVILASYLGSLMMAGGYLAICSFTSALTRSQVIAFVISVVLCFVLTVTGLPAIADAVRTIAPRALVDTLVGLSFLNHFNAIMNGVIDMRDLVFFTSTTALFLYATALVIHLKKGA
jgi:ABC-2 type transport system permease protein